MSSHRYASAFAMPAAASADDQSIHTIQPDSGILSNGSVFIHFTRSFTASSVSTKSVNLASGAFPFIWSYNDDEPPSPVDSPTANMNKHIFAEPMGRITLFETAPNSGSGNTGGNNIQTADKLDPKNPYILAHGILMFLAWGVFAPAGVAVAVFAKGQKWFPTHFYTMSLLTILCTLAGFGLAVYYVVSTGTKSFTNPHEIIGLTVVCSSIVQMFLGVYIHHLYNPNRTKRPIRNHIHIWFGRAVFLLGAANVGVGITRYGTWYNITSQTNPYLYAYIGWIVAWTAVCAGIAYGIRKSVIKSQQIPADRVGSQEILYGERK